MAFYSSLIPLGKFTITAGTTQLLTANLGPQKQIPGAPGYTRTVSQIIVCADAANTGQVVLLPAGSKFSSNPGNIMAAFPKGTSVPISTMGSMGIVLDTLCFDCDTGTNIVYAMAIAG